jgi:tetratricopeptide (TPR) repeat protein
MRTFRNKARLLPLLLLSAFLSSCAAQRKASFEPLLSQSRQYFEAGEFQKSIDSYSAALKKYPDKQAIPQGYTGILEEMKGQADLALEKRDFTSAESVYSILLKNYPRFKPVEKSLSFTPQLLNQQIKSCLLGLSKGQAEELVQAGDFEKALNLHKGMAEKYDNDAGLAADLTKTMEDIKRLADEAEGKEDFVLAGKAYSALSANYSFYEKLVPSPPFLKASLEEGLKKCRVQLTQKGLEQYRKGNLAEAIAVWQKILLFDPDNIEIKKSIDTATEQLKKLQKKERE